MHGELVTDIYLGDEMHMYQGLTWMINGSARAFT